MCLLGLIGWLTWKCIASLSEYSEGILYLGPSLVLASIP